ncbi:MAG TPA: class I SAM-dependent methyltransferase [Candidatus Dormibacteraeota bacterium]
MQPYEGLAPYYDLLYEQSRQIDFGAEDAQLVAEIRRLAPDARTLLEVGCGTGIRLANLRAQFSVEGVDLSPAMLRVARRRLPGVRLHQGDFTAFKLRRRFDVVACLFSGIAYARTVARLRRAIRNLADHLAPGGVLVLDGWVEPGRWKAGTLSVDDASDGEVAIVRLSRSSRRGRLAVMEWDFLLARRGRVEHFTERHEVGLFERRQFVEALEAAGLEVVVDPEGCFGRGRYFGVKP